jgi:hypothetical protein
MTQWCVYALTDAPIPGGRIGGHRIDAVPVGGVFALVEVVHAAPAVTAPALRTQHGIVAELARRVPAILPARFGALVSAAELSRLVRTRRERIQKALDLVRDREQMILRFPGVVPPITPSTDGPATGTEYLRRLVDRQALPPAVDAIRQAVEPHVAATHAVPGRGRIPPSVYHLIPKGTKTEYRRILAEHLPPADKLEVTISGPFPPFAFAPDLVS